MPKITDVDAAIVAAQQELDRGGSSRNKWTVHLPTADYLRLLLLCREEGQNPAQFGLTALTRYADATENGVVLSLPADFRTRLDFVAESLVVASTSARS